MKDIRLRRLVLENFKCHRHLELDFQGRSCDLYGDNGAGKTSVYDGLTWLLFGRDSRGDGEPEVKPLGPDGAVLDHGAVTAAEAELEVDGTCLTLRKTLRELWNGKNGAYQGNTAAYFVDAVPCRRYAYEEKIQDLVGEEAFRVLTQVAYFPGVLPWRQRRALLFQAAGAPSDRELLEREAAFRPLLDHCGCLSLEDYRQKLRAKRKGLVASQGDIPARVAENEERIAALQAQSPGYPGEVESLQRKREELCRELEELRLSSTEKRSLVEGLQAALRALQAENDLFRQEAQGKRADFFRRKEALEAELSRCGRELGLLADREGAGERCASCGQPLLGQALEAVRARQRQAQREARDWQRRQAEALAAWQALGEPPAVRDLPDFVVRRRELEDRLDRARQKCPDEGPIRAALSRVQGELASANARQAARAMIPDLEQRVKDLREQALDARRALEEVDRQLALLEEFYGYKARFLEDRINSHFRLARFRLFRRQVDGSLQERCDVTFGGIPYGGLNAGARVRVGMDIIAGLSAAWGIRAPLFIDNAESVTRWEDTGGQLLRLFVSARDRDLRLERR